MKKTRYCNICLVDKPVSDFYTASYKCKKCISESAKNIPKIDWKESDICLPEEIWLPITGYEGFHEISSLGRLSVLYRSMGTSFQKLPERKILKPPINPYTGYVAHIFAKWGIHQKEKRFNIHRLVGLHFLPNPLNLPEINHINGNKLDNSINNLEWCSRNKNIQHAFSNGLMPIKIGQDNRNSILTNEKVLEIYNSNIGPRELSRRLNLTYSLVAQIKNGTKWTHVTGGTKI